MTDNDRSGRPRRDDGGRRPARKPDAGARVERGRSRDAKPSGRSDRAWGGSSQPGSDRGKPWQDRPERGRNERAGLGRDAHPATDENRPAWRNSKFEKEGAERKRSPLIPDEIVATDLDISVRAQLKTLTAENAEKVARHLAMVHLLLDQDPELAHEHALAAADRAGRLAVVREIVGCTAYAVGDFALALRELLTHKRISGSNEQIALIVDSERGLGRPDRALEVGRSVDRSKLSPAARVNLAIAMSGARLDRGEMDLALAELEIAELNPARVFEYSPALFFAYSDVLEDLGRAAEAKKWAELGNRAAAALAGPSGPEDEFLQVFEEIEIPQRRVWLDDEEYAKVREREARRERAEGDESKRDKSSGAQRRNGTIRQGRTSASRENSGEIRPRRVSDDRPMRKTRPMSDDVRPKRNRD